MAPFYGRGSTASRLEPLRGGSLLNQNHLQPSKSNVLTTSNIKNCNLKALNAIHSLIMFLHVIRMLFVCHSYSSVCHLYMSPACHLYVLVCHPYCTACGLTINQTKIIVTRKLGLGGPYDIGHQYKIFPGGKSKLNVFNSNYYRFSANKFSLPV